MRHLLFPNLQLNRLGYSKAVDNDSTDFADTLINTYGAAEVWKLTDIVSGATIPAHVDSARNGVLQGWDLQNTASPIVGDAGLAPFSDGINDYGNIQSASLSSLFNGSEGSLMIFARTDNWGTGTKVAIIMSSADSSNRVSIQRPVAQNGVHCIYRSAGTTRTIAKTGVVAPTGWFCSVLTWSQSNDRLIAYFNGAAVSAGLTGLVDWTGTDLDVAVIGALTAAGASSFPGWVSYPTLWTRELSDAEVLAIYEDATT